MRFPTLPNFIRPKRDPVTPFTGPIIVMDVQSNMDLSITSPEYVPVRLGRYQTDDTPGPSSVRLSQAPYTAVCLSSTPSSAALKLARDKLLDQVRWHN